MLSNIDIYALSLNTCYRKSILLSRVSDMESYSGIFGLPWKVPSTIVISFITAIIFAFGHHLFYQSLDGVLVRDAVFEQQHNVAIGTAFAFTVRALLLLSIGTTYWQVFWRTLRSKTLRVDNINTLFGLLHNGLSFANVKPLFRHPLLVTIAILSWTVPIAIIVPPATLSIRSELKTSYEFKAMDVPSFHVASMTSTTLDQCIYKQTKDGRICKPKFWQAMLYVGPSEELSRTTMATAYRGSIPAIANPYVNASYTLTFHSPAIRCEAVEKKDLSSLYPLHHTNASGYYPLFAAWTPTKSSLVPSEVKSMVQFEAIGSTFKDFTGITANGSFEFSPFIGQYQDLPPSIFLAWNDVPTEWLALFDPSFSPLQRHNQARQGLNCSFYNATYTASFKFTEGQQEINLESIELLDAPLKLFVPIGYEKSAATVSSPLRTVYTLLHTEDLAGYQGLIEAFGQVLVGAAAIKLGSISTTQTSILKTNLASSNELWALYRVISEKATPQTGLSLATSIEQLFQNMTMSLFSEPSMLTRSRTNTKVTVEKEENFYAYSWRKLVLAYGVAILVTLFTAITGCLTLVATGAAYSSDFSTFMRLIRGQHIDNIVSAYDDRDGADPLPKALAEAEIHIEGTARTTLREEKDIAKFSRASSTSPDTRADHKVGTFMTSSSESRLLSRSDRP